MHGRCTTSQFDNVVLEAVDKHLQRVSINIAGQVQGVGFRPFVYHLARNLNLTGFVCNNAGGVQIEIQGSKANIKQFSSQLKTNTPPLAKIDAVKQCDIELLERSQSFVIKHSLGGPVQTSVTPDTAVCERCLRELFDKTDRRFRYAFTNCTYCGPRYTITSQLPYDRPNTSMAPFPLCPTCKQEYKDPGNRRFHAQPNACPACGPKLSLSDAKGKPLEVSDVITTTIEKLAAGHIVAIKGLGGFHLACDAKNFEAVQKLRQRKNREEKPFAVMATNVASIKSWAFISQQEIKLLTSNQRPIVLLRKKKLCDDVFKSVAPGIDWLGVMLPYSPLHYLLFHQAAGRPEGNQWLEQAQDLALVMTSANPGGEPIVTGNEEAIQRLGNIADFIVSHDRNIVTRCDDSVIRLTGESSQFLRRARGYTPRGIQLASEGPSILACGAWFKNTVCVTRGSQAFVSQHIGDLDNRATCELLEETVNHLLDVLEIKPDIVVRDYHPDFFSSQFATQFATTHNLPLVKVQHHHAHVAAVVAERKLSQPVLGLALDGVGLGDNDEIWGGEMLLVDGKNYQHLGRLKPLPLPGGDKAAREPWRMAASALHLLGRSEEIEKRFHFSATSTVKQMLANNTNTPYTSSAGRWFDAAAGLLGLKPIMKYEGQAAMLLEGLANRYGSLPAIEYGFSIDGDNQLDLLPILNRILEIEDQQYAAALFHSAMIRGLATWVKQAADAHKIKNIVFSGGCFLNNILSNELNSILNQVGMRIWQAEKVPPNDGGISLGQAWIAMQ